MNLETNSNEARLRMTLMMKILNMMAMTVISQNSIIIISSPIAFGPLHFKETTGNRWFTEVKNIEQSKEDLKKTGYNLDFCFSMETWPIGPPIGPISTQITIVILVGLFWFYLFSNVIQHVRRIQITVHRIINCNSISRSSNTESSPASVLKTE